MKTQFKRLWSELVRRRVVRTGAVYAVVAFVILQLCEIAFPAYGIGPEGMRALITGLIAASPLALAASWVFDVSAPTIHRTPDLGLALGEGSAPSPPPVPAMGIVLVAALGLGAATWSILGGMSLSSPMLIVLPSILACVAALFAVGWCSSGYRQPESTPTRRSVAVLPFPAWGSRDAHDLGQVLAEEIRIRLQDQHGLLVAARQSSTDATAKGDVRALGRRLAVSSIVEGSLVQRGDEVRVSVQLVDARSGFRVSSHSRSFKMSEASSGQGRVAETIVSGLFDTPSGPPRLRAV